jgi:lysylphosphatidylglycerol synthetase-like protein (DUF2156 family)
MMDEINELDKLKHAWKTMADFRSNNEYSVEEIKKMVSGRSNNELSLIRRKIIIEWSMALLLSLFLVLFIYFFNPGDTRYALLLVLIILAVSFVPYLKVIRLKHSSHTNLKIYLAEFIFRFEKLIKQYIQMAAILMPIAGLGGFLLGLHSVANQSEWEVMFKLTNLVLVFLLVILISFVGYWMQKRYFAWIYGKNMERLRNCLKDLEEADNYEEQ